MATPLAVRTVRAREPRIDLAPMGGSKLGTIRYDQAEATWVVTVEADADLLTQLDVIEGLVARVTGMTPNKQDGIVYRQADKAPANRPEEGAA